MGHGKKEVQKIYRINSQTDNTQFKYLRLMDYEREPVYIYIIIEQINTKVPHVVEVDLTKFIIKLFNIKNGCIVTEQMMKSMDAAMQEAVDHEENKFIFYNDRLPKKLIKEITEKIKQQN